jgi:hypothetical protein
VAAAEGLRPSSPSKETTGLAVVPVFCFVFSTLAIYGINKKGRMKFRKSVRFPSGQREFDSPQHPPTLSCP